MKRSQYHQRLTPKKAAEGIHVIIENAQSLLSDAELLFNNERYERTVTLAVLAIEEIGKIPIVRSILLEDNQKELSKAWKNFRTHTEKNWGLYFSDYVQNGAGNIDDLKLMFIDDKSKNRVENIKRLSIYTDYFKNDNWSSPTDVVDKELAQSMLNNAKIFVSKRNSLLSSEEGLRLWIKHLKPVWKKEMPIMKKAMIEFYKEAKELDLLGDSINMDMVEKFINQEGHKNNA